VVDVAGLGHADRRVHEQVRVDVARRPERQLLVGAVHGIARLEGDDALPAARRKVGANLRGRFAQRLEIVVRRQLNRFDAAADVHRVRAHHGGDARVFLVGRAEDALGLEVTIGRPDVFDVEDREHHPFRIAQRHLFASRNAARELFGHVERDRHRPERSGRRAIVGDDQIDERSAVRRHESIGLQHKHSCR